MLQSFANLPRPVQAVLMLATGGSLVSIVMSFIPGPMQGFFIYIAIGVAIVAVLLGLYKLVMILRDKTKSGPFSSMLAKGSRTTADPALKARMDDLRRKFEEGVVTFKQAGKDLYSLPWYLLAGPAGSGKTEALRHSNVGFPPGLQDPLQGSGGTLNMHWWFTNHSVVIDTAGRMFMEGADEGGGAEWKEFLKLLRTARPNCPINGMLLVISSENLLKDSAEKIEQTAGAIARQLDVIQRTLDVRFPVTVVVTKCDKIVGFREFFEHISDPNLQHQILGWSNPQPLDEVFKPDQVDKHLDSVRQKLMRRRMGLIQNPVHTSDPTARRTDQVDEMFELPDNLVRIAPRLRRYLEMIFVAGEWSPKPLFLRGIYFTSSMREGQALDVSLAQALGVDVESIPGGKNWDREKSYFLRDVFMAKVFKEKGLVTKATNVSKALAKQRALLVGGAMVTTIVLGGIAVLGYLQFNTSLGPPSKSWSNVRVAVAGDGKGKEDPFPLKEMQLIGDEGAGTQRHWVYTGNHPFTNTSVLGSSIATPADLVAETGSYQKIDPPLIARPIAPFLGFTNSFLDAQEEAHRALVERTVIVPLLDATRSKLQGEEAWDKDAVAALAQLVRIQTYSYEAKPMIEGGLVGDLVNAGKDAAKDGGKDLAKDAKAIGSKRNGPAIDIDALFRYVLGKDAADDPKGYKADRDRLVSAVKAAYPNGFSGLKPSAQLGGQVETWRLLNEDAVKRLADRMKGGGSPGGDMGALIQLQTNLAAFLDAEKILKASQWLKAQPGAAAGGVRTLEAYTSFETDVGGQLKRLAAAKAAIDEAVAALGAKADNLPELLASAGEQWKTDAGGCFDRLLEQLPKGMENPLAGKAGDGKAAEAAGKIDLDTTKPELKALRKEIVERREAVVAAVAQALDRMKADIQTTASLVTPGRTASGESRAYAARASTYKIGGDEVAKAGQALTGTMSLAARLDEIDGLARKAGEAAQAWTSWTGTAAGLKALSEDQKTALTASRDEAEGITRRIAEIAAARRVHEAVRTTIKAWPKDLDKMKAAASALARVKIDAGAAPLTRPKVKLTEMAEGGEFDASFSVDAAKEILGDWAKIRELIEPGSTGNRQVMDPEALKKEGYPAAGQVTESYASEYVKYWRRQATEATAVTAANWGDFAKELGKLYHYDLEVLKQLQDTCTVALAGVPAGVMPRGPLDDAKGEVVKAFSGLSNEALGPNGGLRASVSKWRALGSVTGGATGAVEMLRAAQRGGDIQADYFSYYGKGVSYWDGLMVRGLELLTEATQGDIARAQNLLLSSSKVPLCFGGPTLEDLSAEQLRAVAEAATQVAANSGSGSGTTTKPAAGLEPRIADLLSRLFGANFIKSDPARQAWFGKLQGVLEKVAGKDPVKLSLNLSDKSSSIGEFKYAVLFVNGKKVGEAFNIFSASTIPENKAKDLTITLPVQSSEIGLYVQDPKNDNVPPVKTLPITGPWSLLGTMLRNKESDRIGPGVWTVKVASPNDNLSLWLTIKIEPDMPAKVDWPTFEGWPGQ